MKLTVNQMNGMLKHKNPYAMFTTFHYFNIIIAFFCIYLEQVRQGDWLALFALCYSSKRFLGLVCDGAG